MAKPVHIFVDRQELLGFTSMSLTRDKTDMTGELSVTLFMGYMPNEPVLDGVIRGEEILVYIGGELAFTGEIDRRTDTGEQSRNSKGQFQSGSAGAANASVGPDQYTVRISARGKTKALVDSSHQSNTTLLSQTGRSAFEELIAPWGISLDWQAGDFDLGRVRLNDGSTVFEELERLAENIGLYVFETKDGRLRVTETTSTTSGEPLVLGTNILWFETDQLGDKERNQILVKGRRTRPEDFGADAILPTIQRVADGAARSFSPVTVQLYGDATEDAIQRRALYEANKQASLTKTIEVEVFHVQQTTGDPWDLGDTHYVEIPPTGVVGTYEVTKVVYEVEAEGTLKTSLTLSPVQAAPNPATSQLLEGVLIPETSVQGAAAQLGLGGLSGSWSSATLTNIASEVETFVGGLLQDVQEAAENLPPLKLPTGFTSGSENE